MSSPLDNNQLTFFLQFNNEEGFGEIPITEAVKFDGATFIVEQEELRYGRDISFVNESIDLFFYKGFYDTTENPLMLPGGTIVYNLTMGFEHLIETRKKWGFESDIVFGIRKSGIDFILGNLDFSDAETDEISFISCKAIQDSEKQQIKRRNEISVDVFSDEDLDGEYIEPLTPVKMLLKAKPLVQESKWQNLSPYWIQYPNFTADNIKRYINPFNAIQLSDIENTLTFLDRTFFITATSTDEYKFTNKYNTGIVDSKNIMVDNVLTLSDIRISLFIPVGDDIEGNWENSLVANKLEVIIFKTPTANTDPLNFTEESFFIDLTYEFLGTESLSRFSGLSGNADRYDVVINEEVFNLDDIDKDYRVSMFFIIPRGNTVQEWLTGNSYLKTTSISVDTIVKGVRYIDLFKQSVKSINGFSVYAPRFDVGGEFYDQLAFNGNLIKNRDDVAFNVKFKDLVETLREVNGGYQVLDDKVFIGKYEDFYPNKEIAVLQKIPDDTAVLSINDRFSLNQVDFEYSYFEQDKDESNTTDAVHTLSQWLLANKQVENKKAIQLKQVRDPFKIVKVQKEAIKTTTSTDDDDKLYLVDMVSLAPGTNETLKVSLIHSINVDGNLQLLNDGTFSWNVLGISIGDTIELLNTSNIGSYEVLEIADGVITLLGGTTSIAAAITEVKYFYTGVDYINRTNEGFTLIENLLNPDNFSNLKYTIKRNLKHWYSYLATSSKFWIDKALRNTEFKNNGELTTQYEGESEATIEIANVNNIDLGNPILTENLYKTRLVVDYETMVGILNALNTINEDDTIGGFIRTFNNIGKVLKLYPQKLEYEPATETLTLTGEQKYESEIIDIYSLDGFIYIDDVPYVINTDLDWFDISNDYLVIYDNNNLPIIDPTNYANVTVKGELSGSNIELSEKLIEII